MLDRTEERIVRQYLAKKLRRCIGALVAYGIHRRDHQLVGRDMVEAEVVDPIQVGEVAQLLDIGLFDRRRRRHIAGGITLDRLVLLGADMLGLKTFAKQFAGEARDGT